MRKIKIKVCLYIINHFFCMTRFFKLKRQILEYCGVSVGAGTSIVGPIYFNPNVKLSIGCNCWIGKDFRIEGNGEVMIGDNCDFGPSITLLTGSHVIGDKSRRAGKGITGSIVIGNGIWVGARSMVLPNIIINDSAVIAAGAVVVNDVESSIVVGGVPAKKIKSLE